MSTVGRDIRFSRTTGRFEIRFEVGRDFNALLAGVRGLTGRKWHHEAKYWSVPETMVAEVRVYAEKHSFSLDAVAEEKIEEYLSKNGNGKRPRTVVDWIADAKGKGVVELRDEGFVVTFPHNPVVQQYAETIPGVKIYSKGGDTRVFITDLSVRYLAAMIERYSIPTPEPVRERITALMEPIDREPVVPDVESPLKDGRKLFAHQREDAVRLARGRRLIVGNEMGTGKTLTALVAAKAFCDAPYGARIIIVCPASMKLTWERESYAVGLRRYYITSWAKIPDASHDLFQRDKFVLIADEAHYAQAGTSTTRGKKFLALAAHENCIACWPLTGTPMKNGNPANIFPLLRAVRHPVAQNEAQYRRLYCGLNGYTRANWGSGEATNLDVLHDQIADALIQRKKAECLDLPEKLRVMYAVEETAAIKRVYEEKLRQYIGEHMDIHELGARPGDLAILTFDRHAVSHAKLDSTAELAQEVLSEGRPVVIFTSFVDTARLLAQRLQDANSSFMAGETPLPERDRLVSLFQEGATRVFVSTVGAGGVGLTLTAASDVIMHDRPWTPGDTVQAEDRLHRIGQRNAVTAYWMQYGSIDRHIDTIIQLKHGNITETLDGERTDLEFELAAAGSLEEIASVLVKNINIEKYIGKRQ